MSESKPSDEPPVPIQISPRINFSLSNVYQAIMIFIALASVALAGITAYFTLSGRVSTLENWKIVSEDEIKESHKSAAEFQSEMRAALGKLQDTLGDIRERLPRHGGP